MANKEIGDFTVANTPFNGSELIHVVQSGNSRRTTIQDVSSAFGGFRNLIFNGDMKIDQRNAGSSQTVTAGAALAYCVDRFYAYCTGANVTGQRVSNTGASAYRYRFTGAASVTAIGFGQRIESINSRHLAGKTATLSILTKNSLLTTVTWSAYYANTENTFGTLASPTRTLINTGSFTVTSTEAQYSTNISIPSAATTGIEIVLSVGAQTSGTWEIGDVQLELGTVATQFERRPIGLETFMCMRYYLKTIIPTFRGYNVSASNVLSSQLSLSVPMRSAPTGAIVTQPSATSNITGSIALTVESNTYFIVYFTGTAAGQSYYSSDGVATFSSEL